MDPSSPTKAGRLPANRAGGMRVPIPTNVPTFNNRRKSQEILERDTESEALVRKEQFADEVFLRKQLVEQQRDAMKAQNASKKFSNMGRVNSDNMQVHQPKKFVQNYNQDNQDSM